MAKNLFTKSSIQRHKEEKSVVRGVTQRQLEEDSPGSSVDVWSNDPLGTGLKNTQQLLVDWSDFTKHVFFNSAEAKVNLAFEQVINGYPFDGTTLEKTEFISGIGGYTKWIYDQFDSNTGYLGFDGTTYCRIEDQTGKVAPDLVRIYGEAKASEGFHINGSTHEFWIYVESTGVTDTATRIVYQKRDISSSEKAISIWTSGVSATHFDISFHISSDRFKALKHTISSLEYDKWQHVAFVYERAQTERIYGYVNGEYHSNTSLARSELDNVIMGDSIIFIGGANDSWATFAQNLSAPAMFIGLLDELRVWACPRTISQIKSCMHKNVDAQFNLQLYHRFNEPAGTTYQASSVILDYSGNSLHTFVYQGNGGFDPKAIQVDSSGNEILPPLQNEKLSDNKILFPDWPYNSNLNSSLLKSASQYDKNNPNLITRLVPPHYFEEAQFFEGIERDISIPENMSVSNVNSPIPGHGLMPTKLVMLSFLYVWANFFDDIKLYIDSFSDLHKVTYDTYDQIPPQLILFLSDYYGISLPNPYANEAPSRFKAGDNLTNEKGNSTPLSKTLDLMWRRILINFPFLLRSRGTLTGIKALMNTLGIEADSMFRFREFGGSISKSITAARKKKRKQSGFLDFSKIDYIESSPIWAYRHEPGSPDITGGPVVGSIAFQAGDITIGIPDGPPVPTTFTSGSWSWEGRYVIPDTELTSSLFRIERGNDILVNLVSMRASNDAGPDFTIKLFLDGHQTSSDPVTKPPIELELPGVNIWDNNPWYISVSNEWGDTENTLSIRCIKTSGDYIVEHYSSSINYTKEASPSQINGNVTILHAGLPLFEADDASSVQNDLKWVVGIDPNKDYSLGTTNQDDSVTDPQNPVIRHYPSEFGGTLSHMRFWTKALNRNEQVEHAQNPYSVTVSNPINSFTFPNKPIVELQNGVYETIPLGKYSGNYDGTLPVGSWERLRQSFDMMQPTTSFDSNGELVLIDTTQNNDHATVYGSEGGYFIDDFIFTIVSPDFDSNSTSNKIRIRSFQDKETALDNFAHHGTLHELPFEVGVDDRRFSIEASLVHALNEDIINLVGNASILNQYLGAPEMEYAVEYPEVKKLMDIYFQRLTGKVNYNAIIEFQRWFNNNFATLIEQFIPHTADFLGINFVIESHMLERHKMEYKQGDVHVDIFDRQAFSQEPLFLGTIRSEIT